MRNVRLLVPPGDVAVAAYLKERTAASLPDVYIALLEIGVGAANLDDLVPMVAANIDRRATAAKRAAKSKPKGGDK